MAFVNLVPSDKAPPGQLRLIISRGQPPLRERLERDYNICYSRRRFLKPLVSAAELREMAELERQCFPPCENYDVKTLRMFVSLNGAGLLRFRDQQAGGPPVLAAFHLFDCLTSELITLDVHPAWRRRGIGRILVCESMARLREIGHDRVQCQIGISNEGSLELHRRLGFETRRLLQDYYGPGRHAFLMSAKL